MPSAINIASKKPRKKIEKNNPEELKEKISKAAYFLSEQRGFDGNDIRNWLEAEASISRN